MTSAKLLHFSILIIILSGGIGVLYFLRGNPASQLAAGIATAIAYVIWGIIHHLMEKDLHPKVVIEYVLVATIAIVVLTTALR